MAKQDATEDLTNGFQVYSSDLEGQGDLFFHLPVPAMPELESERLNRENPTKIGNLQLKQPAYLQIIDARHVKQFFNNSCQPDIQS